MLEYSNLFELVDKKEIASPFERLRDIEHGERSCDRYPRIPVVTGAISAYWFRSRMSEPSSRTSAR